MVTYTLPYDAIIAIHGSIMFILNQAIALVSVPPGSFIYHIVGLFALEAAFAMSFSQYRRAPESEFDRFALAAGAALCLRVVLVILAGLAAPCATNASRHTIRNLGSVDALTW